MRPLSEQIATTVVVNNAGPRADEPPLRTVLADLPRTIFIDNAENLGIAAALNQGLRELRARGLRWAMLLDHDSAPQHDTLSRLLASAKCGQPTNAAVWVPRIDYALPEILCRWPVTHAGSRWRFKRMEAGEMLGPTAVDLAISSGMLVDLKRLPEVGLFREGLFIDLVDTEFCLRVRDKGFAVIAVPEARLTHALGEVSRRHLLGRWPVYPTHHGPMRHYFISRNRIFLMKLYARRFPSWALYEALSGMKLLAKVMLFERDRRQKLAASLRGTWEGLRESPPKTVPLKE